MAAYDIHGMVEFAEPVPFRLTRNLQTFFTPFGVEGLFISSMCAAAQAVVAPKVLFHQVMIFPISLAYDFCSCYCTRVSFFKGAWLRLGANVT